MLFAFLFLYCFALVVQCVGIGYGCPTGRYGRRVRESCVLCNVRAFLVRA